MAAVLLWSSSARHDAALLRSPTNNLIAVAERTKAPPLRPRLAELVAYEPLNQDALNAVYFDRTLHRIDPTRSGKLRRVLTSLGWRSTATSQNLMLSAALEKRFADVVASADALLRRDQFKPQALQLLFLSESAPEMQAALAKSLVQGPNWRHDFFTAPEGLATADAAKARLATVQALLRRNVHLGRTDLQPLVAALVRFGREDQAWQLWRAQLAPGAPDAGLYDSGFTDVGGSGSPGTQQTPFDWALQRGSGYSAYTSGGQSGSALSITWDGRGLPVFAEQQFRRPDRPFIVSVESADLTDAALAKIALTLDCGDVVTPLLVTGRFGATIQFKPSAPVRCDYPVLRLRARTSEQGGTLDLVVKRISTAPLSAG